jgi:hypothetical protein
MKLRIPCSTLYEETQRIPTTGQTGGNGDFSERSHAAHERHAYINGEGYGGLTPGSVARKYLLPTGAEKRQER